MAARPQKGKMDIKGTCSLAYYPAAHTSGRREFSDIKWIVLHSEEASTAKSAAQWFENPDSQGSAHLAVDDTICYRCLMDKDVPWGAASAKKIGANWHGFHIEQAGFAKWQSITWFKHMPTLRRAAYKTAVHLKKFKLPIKFVDARMIINGEKGITTHREISQASRTLEPQNASDFTHYDPGIFWPKGTFMRLVKNYCKEIGYEGI